MSIQNFLFGPYPLALENIDKIFLYDVLGALAFGLVLSLVLYFAKLNAVKLGLIRRFRNLTLTYGLAGLLFAGFRYEGAAYLSWRFWPIVLASAALVWLVKIVIYWLRGYQKDLANLRNQELKQKYLK